MTAPKLTPAQRRALDALWPQRPGTCWEMRHHQGNSWCAHCGQGYNSHGAPSDEAKRFDVPENQRHLICPASEDQWEAYRAAQRALAEQLAKAVR